MNKNNEVFKIKKSLVNNIRKWAIIILIIELAILYITNYLIPSHLELFKNIESLVIFNNLIKTINSLTIAIIPLTTIAIFIHPIFEKFSNLDQLIKNDFLIDQLSPIKTDITDIVSHIRSLGVHNEIYSIDYSYNDTDWSSLLKNANVVTFCMLYTGTHWNKKYISYFEEYIKRGGKLKIFLPDSSSEIQSQFYNKQIISKVTSDKIHRTIQRFREINKDNQVEVKVLKKGFHYMFARIEKNDTSIFLFSPYANNYEKNEAPVIAFDEKYVNNDMKNFINKEIEYLNEDSTIFPDFELEKYIVWKTNRNRVFISAALFCDVQCKFCYVDSLIKQKNTTSLSPTKLAKMICEVVRNDPRFNNGPNGTTIMLSSFNDPFHKKYIEASIEIINIFSIHKNVIDIATRFPLGDKETYLSDSKDNILINFSVASLKSDIEINNQYDRFTDAKELISKGYTVLLYLRPIIPNLTKNDLDSIINLAKDAKIKYITIGGIYVDEKITAQLSRLEIDVSKYTKDTKDFVLDDENILKKLKIDDINFIQKKLQENGFTVFTTSDQRIDNFKHKLSETI